MTKPVLLLAVSLLLGAALGASAAPRHAAPTKHLKPSPAKPTSPLSVPTPQATSGFPDVPPGHWAAQSVETLRRAGIMQGYPNGTYRTGQ